MKAFHNAYAALTNKLEGKNLTELLNLKGLFKPYSLSELLNPQKNIYKVWGVEGEGCQVAGILIATRFGNIIIHQKYSNNDSLIVIKCNGKLQCLLMIGIKDILSSEQILRLVGGNPNTIDNEHFFCEPNASWFIDRFTVPPTNRPVYLEVGKRYVDYAGNIIEIVEEDILETTSVFISSEGVDYWPEGFYAEHDNASSVLNIALEI